VAIASAALDAMAATRAVILDAVSRRVAIYGVTTGLGSRASEALSGSELSAFSLQTLRGRAHASGPPLPADSPALAAVLAHIRSISPALEHDRPLGPDLDNLAGAIHHGAFARLAPQ
jgi:histidine ammonia-lyase